MIISLNPTYLCNFRNGKCAKTCYLTADQLASESVLDLEVLKKKVLEVKEECGLDHIDLYGGEITLLPDSYQFELASFLTTLNCSVNVVTNYSRPDSIILTSPLTNGFDISVSWDYTARQGWSKVLKNMQETKRPFAILSLASPEFARHDPEDFFEIIAKLENLICFEIKPYSQNQSNSYSFGHKDYEKLVQKYIEVYERRKYPFMFTNIELLKDSLAKEKVSWSDEHLYLNPRGEWCVLDFDDKGREYFHKVFDLAGFKKWEENEKRHFKLDPVCSKCSFLGHCLSEHLRPIVNFESEGCSGYRGLIEWYDERRLR